MIGIWEYFWDLLDWTGVPDTKNILNITALVGSLVDVTGPVSAVTSKTINTASLTTKIGNI